MNADIRAKLVSKIRDDKDGKSRYVFEYDIERGLVARFFWQWDCTITVKVNDKDYPPIIVKDNDGSRPTVNRVFDTVTDYIERHFPEGFVL